MFEYFIEVQNEQFPSGMTKDDFREVGEGTIIKRIEHLPSRYVIQRF